MYQTYHLINKSDLPRANPDLIVLYNFHVAQLHTDFDLYHQTIEKSIFPISSSYMKVYRCLYFRYVVPCQAMIIFRVSVIKMSKNLNV